MAHQLTHHQVQNRNTQIPLEIVCENLRTPENVGMIFRLAEAMGVSMVYLTGDTPHPGNKKVTQVSRSTSDKVPWETAENVKEILESKSEFQILALEITKESIPIQDYILKPNQQSILIIGSEKYGITEEALVLANQHIHIPMYGVQSSLNVATATAIALFHLRELHDKN